MGDKSKSCSIEKCQSVLADIYRSSVRVNEILNNLSTRPIISCQDCSIAASDVNKSTRAVLRDTFPLEISICCNRVKESEIEEVIIHELIHAYDYSKGRCDFSTCPGLAYSEVRAALEAECAKGYFPFEFMRQSCVRDVAIRSTSNLFPKGAATSCVDAVLSQAMKDLEPTSATSFNE